MFPAAIGPSITPAVRHSAQRAFIKVEKNSAIAVEEKQMTLKGIEKSGYASVTCGTHTASRQGAWASAYRPVAEQARCGKGQPTARWGPMQQWPG